MASPLGPGSHRAWVVTGEAALLAAVLRRTRRQPCVRPGQRWGVAAICIGVGQGLGVVLENTRA